MSRPVDIWVDPACPWAWITSRWLVEAAGVRDLDVRFHVMSLAILNADKATTPEYAEWLKTAHRPVRVLIAAEQRHGNAVLGPLYAAMGTRHHVNQEEDFDEVIPRSLADVGLEADLADAALSEEFDELLRASHEAGMALVGHDVGTPVIRVGDVAFFGPVVTPAPKGEAAGILFDGLMAVAGTPGFYEIKRTRTERPSFV